MACSAVVIELPNGVFITMMPFLVAAGMSTLSTPMPARPMTFRLLAAAMTGRHLGGRADGEAVIWPMIRAACPCPCRDPAEIRPRRHCPEDGDGRRARTSEFVRNGTLGMSPSPFWEGAGSFPEGGNPVDVRFVGNGLPAAPQKDLNSLRPPSPNAAFDREGPVEPFGQRRGRRSRPWRRTRCAGPGGASR